MILTIITGLFAAIVLWGLTEGVVRAMKQGRFDFSLRKKLEFCLLNGFLAADLILIVLMLAGVSISFWQVILIMPVTVFIYYSILRGFTVGN